jgi:hypothetical protein
VQSRAGLLVQSVGPGTTCRAATESCRAVTHRFLHDFDNDRAVAGAFLVEIAQRSGLRLKFRSNLKRKIPHLTVSLRATGFMQK